MSRILALLFFLAAALLSTRAGADVIITLNLSDSEGNALAGPVPPGTTVLGELLLSTGSDEDPLPDIRLIQFDFTNTSGLLTVQGFEWTFDPGQGQSMYLLFADLPVPQVAYSGMGRMPGFIVDLGGEPVPVAEFQVLVAGGGTLDALGAELEGGDAGARVRAGFDLSLEFQPVLGNLSGGTAELTVTGGSTPDGAEPTDPGQGVDSDPGDAGGDEGQDPGDSGEPGGDDPGDGSDAGDDVSDDPGDDTGDDPGDGTGDDPGDGAGDDPGTPGDDGGDANPGDGGDAEGDGDGQGENTAGDTAGTCGVALIGPSLFSLGILSAVRLRRRLAPWSRG